MREGHETPWASIFLLLSGQTGVFPADSSIPKAEARAGYLRSGAGEEREGNIGT